jgi:metal-responsive CopG/Arc/MetJ family transcriptional regulator
MVHDMATKKVTITLPEDMVEKGHELAREDGMSFSAWIAELTEDEIRRQDGLAAMREWERVYGPFTDEEIARADADIDRAEAAIERIEAELGERKRYAA